MGLKVVVEGSYIDTIIDIFKLMAGRMFMESIYDMLVNNKDINKEYCKKKLEKYSKDGVECIIISGTLHLLIFNKYNINFVNFIN
jgi:hypothetical protein